MTNEAVIAANRILNVLPTAQYLSLERKVTVIKNSLLFLRRNHCHCDDESEKIIKIPTIFPIFATEGLVLHGYYSSVPLAYISWLIPSNLIPVLEVIETPLFYTSMIFKKKEKFDIDKTLLTFGESFIISSKKVTFPCDIQLLNCIRTKVLIKIMELSNKNAMIRLSIFEDLPKIILTTNSIFLNPEEDMRPQAQLNDLGTYHTKRLMPLIHNKQLIKYNLHSWLITKKDLNL